MKRSLQFGLAASLAALGYSSAIAQDRSDEGIGTSPLIGKLETCTAIENDAERLACFDREVGTLVGASNKGDVKVVDSEQISEARKKLYGYSLPDAGIFEAATEEEREENKRLVSTITRVRKVGSKEWHFWIEEGNAKWRIKNNSIRARAPEVGQSVEFKPATMGTYWIRIDGRKGVRGNRIG
ncbi:hypothetical protein [Erythrobacter sp. YT30]|uniref:hypothetical protein n=1 Tax=Erythrobacter sp. YT30 TaxID=1735012 RepID=UPI00076CF830|nr:hypothetical protein [Erythrobacter sp. YT30]KWV90361.1 hypothetical protein AUC45_13890 [Erythrobacter sp. YT30]